MSTATLESVTSRPCELTAVDAAKAIASGDFTSEALVESCLERIAERDADVLAWAYVDATNALEQARIADRSPVAGPLHGIPVGLKDIIEAYGMPTGFNSPIYPDYWPKADSACAALIRLAGGIILGKTVTTEFANRHPGATRNPHDLSRTPGGSSSGSGAAVADYQVPLALGTQTSGSMIRPAAYCGVVGYKPSFGEISRVGVKQQSGSLDTVGFCARSVGDIALLRAALTRTPYAAPAESGLDLRVLICRLPEWDSASPEARAEVEGVAARMERAGASIADLPLPPDLFAGWADAHRRIANFEGARNFGFEKTRHQEKLSRALYEGRIQDGERCTLDEYVAAQRTAESLREWYEQATEDFDVILTLASPGEAPLGLAATGSATFNSLWTMLYTPCVTLPSGKGPAGLPLAVQLVGKRFEDERLLSIATAIEPMLKA